MDARTESGVLPTPTPTITNKSPELTRDPSVQMNLHNLYIDNSKADFIDPQAKPTPFMES